MTNGELCVMGMPVYTNLVREDFLSATIQVEAQDSETPGWKGK